MSDIVENVAKAIWEAESLPAGDDVQGWQRAVASAAIAAVDAHRAEEKRKNCKHWNRMGTGNIGSNGFLGWSAWYCQECGASYDSRKAINAVE